MQRQQSRSSAPDTASLDAAKTKSDSLQDATRYLANMTPLNRPKVELEVQLHLNKWWITADRKRAGRPSPDCSMACHPTCAAMQIRWGRQFSQARCQVQRRTVHAVGRRAHVPSRIHRQLANWIVQRPLQDSLLSGWLEGQAKVLPPEQFAELEGAFKLFDWSIRNIVLDGQAQGCRALPDDPSKAAGRQRCRLYLHAMANCVVRSR